ncbi:hypothetical protein E4U17_007000 [Claviceps sp. LM77 group G4]|nr:hypothetical protein E4U17_007000 [Claviceps sp. LM77 group G4]KAG6059710.1 hypothetical protein E4U33_007074 [Claviceps sp. LM78 group G4]
MGSLISKQRHAAASTTRRYPSQAASHQNGSSRVNIFAGSHERKSPTEISDVEDLEIPAADFSRRLRDVGTVKLHPISSRYETSIPTPYSPSTGQNITISVLQARKTLQQLASDNVSGLGSSSGDARRFADMRTTIDAVRMRDRGLSDGTIEQILNFQPGVMKRVGSIGMITYIAQKR